MVSAPDGSSPRPDAPLSPHIWWACATFPCATFPGVDHDCHREKSKKKAAKQLKLDLPEAIHQCVLYEYAVLVTSLKDEVRTIAQHTVWIWIPCYRSAISVSGGMHSALRVFDLSVGLRVKPRRLDVRQVGDRQSAYSWRRASTGSILPTRNAGISAAHRAAIARIASAPSRISKSSGLTPNVWC
jgi:hypothetical protein